MGTLMARKNVLEGLMKREGGATPPAPASPRRSAGAIGAVSQSLADLRTRALTEVPSDMIDDAGLHDRLDNDPAGIGELARSIEEYGQQVPVMLRHSPNVEGRYEIVYGRRRVAALKRLGRPVRAMIRDLDDKALIVAQGQENSARKDLSFIEKALFARQMEAAGFDRKVICDALHIDKTVVSRMLTVADSLPRKVIEAIGAAPSAGRDRWMTLAKRATGQSPEALMDAARGDSSDERFNAVFTTLAPGPRKPAPPRALTAGDGTELARFERRGGRPVMTFTADDAFATWLADNISEIHRRFEEDRGE